MDNPISLTTVKVAGDTKPLPAEKTADITELDAHEQPSEEMRAAWKAIARAEQEHILGGRCIDDLEFEDQKTEYCLAGTIPAARIASAFSHICYQPVGEVQDVPIYYHPLLPGLLIVPSLVPPDAQKVLLSRMIHRDLSNPNHRTNLHLHYELPYPDGSDETSRSFFSYPPEASIRLNPKDPSVHKPLSMKQVMERRLHWVTLGGQYDWTNRVYPGELPPQFPCDIANFLESLFPATAPQAAIVNFYAPGDTMMMHRDVSEETDKGLVSLSFGCDGLFMIAPSDFGRIPDTAGSPSSKKYLLLRLRSGDAIYMTKESRFAWHGVPKILKGTCPNYLVDWPAENGNFEEWRRWMENKRVNLNVRQMRD